MSIPLNKVGTPIEEVKQDNLIEVSLKAKLQILNANRDETTLFNTKENVDQLLNSDLTREELCYLAGSSLTRLGTVINSIGESLINTLNSLQEL